MWYQINETDLGKLRVGDLLMKHNRPGRPESIVKDKNEFYIIDSVSDYAIRFKKADIIKSSINYSFTSIVTEELFHEYYWYCFVKRMAG